MSLQLSVHDVHRRSSLSLGAEVTLPPSYQGLHRAPLAWLTPLLEPT